MGQDKFMQHKGVETGYFEKRKKKFNQEIAKGIGNINKPKREQKAKSKGNDNGKSA